MGRHSSGYQLTITYRNGKVETKYFSDKEQSRANTLRRELEKLPEVKSTKVKYVSNN